MSELMLYFCVCASNILPASIPVLFWITRFSIGVSYTASKAIENAITVTDVRVFFISNILNS